MNYFRNLLRTVQTNHFLCDAHTFVFSLSALHCGSAAGEHLTLAFAAYNYTHTRVRLSRSAGWDLEFRPQLILSVALLEYNELLNLSPFPTTNYKEAASFCSFIIFEYANLFTDPDPFNFKFSRKWYAIFENFC